MANIQINYYNGSTYQTLYPETVASQIISGTLGSARIPNLDMSKITTGNLASSRISGDINAQTLGGYSYDQIVNNVQSGISNIKVGSYTGTGGEDDITINVGFNFDFFMLNPSLSTYTFFKSNASSITAIKYNLYIYKNTFFSFLTRDNTAYTNRVVKKGEVTQDYKVILNFNDNTTNGTKTNIYNVLNSMYGWIAIKS